jgi:hypothetical protein
MTPVPPEKHELNMGVTHIFQESAGGTAAEKVHDALNIAFAT